MEVLSAIVDKVIGVVWDQGIKKQVTYIFCYNKNFNGLNEGVKRLGDVKERLDRERDQARRKGHIVELRVEEWFREVGEFETQVENYKSNVGHKKTGGFYYLLPYYRHQLGRKAKKMEMEALKLRDESPKLDEVSHAKMITSYDHTSSNLGYIEFDSRKSVMRDIMTKLEDPTVKIIGLHGPRGMGKSTLIKEISNKAQHEKLFDKVAVIDVTKNPNPRKIQEEIAHVLENPLQGESEYVRADYLRRWLKIENVSILIILDHLYERLDLNKLGIPVDDDYDLRKKNELSGKPTEDKGGSADHPKGTSEKVIKENADHPKGTNEKVIKENFLGVCKGCKILLSSHDETVFPDDVKSKFCLSKLDDNDALILFQKKVGGGNIMHVPKEEIKNYCEEIKINCAGLPTEIVSLADAFQKWSESVSEATLDKFKKQGLVEWQKSREIPPLKNEELKSIYLLCAQRGHLPLVMNLVKYCFGLSIFEGVSSLSVVREKINKSIQQQKHLSMFHTVGDDDLTSAHNHHNIFILRDGKLDDWPELQKCTYISICNTDIIDGLPQVINCPRLKFFQIDTHDPSLKIPENFFRGMKNLKVLILSGFHLPRLPASIKHLLKLRMLSLERCTLKDNLGIIGELKKLRILSFSGSLLQNVPAGLRCLDKLQLLDISDCSIEEITIPPDLLSSLIHLEELYIRKSLIKMLVGKETNQDQNSFLYELKNLHQLKVVDLSIPCVSVLPNHLFFDRLKDYKILVGDSEMFSVGKFRMPNKYEERRVLALQLKDDTNIHSQIGIKLLFKTVQSLLLGKMNVEDVVNKLNIDGFPDLKHLSIINNNNIKYVNSTKLSNSVDVFPNLEWLSLYNLRNLEMICYVPIKVASFAKLKTIKVEMCNRLENLFTFYTLKFPISAQISECNSYMDKFLANLEIIEVSDCGSLNKILQIPVNHGKVKFLKLQTLTLQSLPSFTCFYMEVERSCRPHLIEAQITNRDQTNITTEEDEHSDKTPPLFGEKVKFPNIENLNLSSLNIHKIWSDQNSSSIYFQNLIKLVVKDCHKLTYLCSLSMASSLKKLKNLVISDCSIMEKIFETGGISADKVCVFPKLEEIHLSKMNKLTNMWQNKVSVDSFSSLISVNIEECNQLDKIFPSHMEGWFESLVSLKVSSCNYVKEIFEINDSQEKDTSSGIDTNLQVILLKYLPKLKQLWSKDPDGILNFKKLRTIEVCNCYELSNLFPTSVARDVSNLERMSALECEKMVEIVTSNDASKANSDPLVFPKLTYVRLYGLPSIKHFYKGRHPIKCPQLKELSMDKSVKLKTFHKETDETTTEEEFVFSAEAVFPNLEYLEIDFMEAQNLLPNYQMHRLKELIILNSVQNRDLLYPFLYGMPNLEKLKLTPSYSQTFEPRADIRPQEKVGTVLELKQLFVCFSDIEDLGFEGDQVLQRLELLRLKGCHKLRNLGPSSVSLTYLTCLKLKNCSGLRNVMASSTAKSMVQLETMKVINCDKVEEIVSKEGSEEGKMMKIKFNKLTTIELVGLENMRSFSSNKECEFEFPSLEIVVVRECPTMEKFSERRPIAPKLKNIFGVKGDENAKWQWEGHLNASIDKVFNEKVTFTYSEALLLYNSSEFIEQLWHGSHSVQHNSFGYLKRLSAWGCETLKHVIPSHLLSCFQNLEELEVENCSAARVIFNINDEKRMTEASGIFRLKSLYLFGLPKLEHIWDKDPEGVIGLQMLKEMRVSRCEGLESLFPASVAKDLTRLQVLEVRECKELAEIFRKDKEGEEGEGTTQDSLFPRLTTLTLLQLPRLNYSLHSSKQQESISNMSWRDSPLQELRLGSWPIPNSCFGLLDSLTLDGCQFLSDILLPFNLLLFLTHLKKLKVRNCNSVKAIFGVKCTTQDRDVTSLGPSLPFSLKKLTVSKLPNLKNVWNVDPHEILSMHHLRKVNVKECKRLTSVFPTSVAKTIKELENLVVEDCERLMNIVAEYNMDPRETNQELMLPWPYVRSLKLQTLPKFKYFYYYSLRCDIFTHLESHTENQVYIEECLSLGENGVEMILRGEFQRNLLHNLKALTLCFRSDVFGYEILEQVPNIEKLVVCDGSFKEMFCCKSPNDVDYSGLLLHLKVLQLEYLGELVSIGLENSWTEPFVRNLETFEVISCSSLKYLVACTVSFSSLTCLKVESCHKLSYLLTSSTVKSLGELKRMEIQRCESIEEIVSKEEKESDEDEIIFPKLNCLNLHGLRMLRRFYRGSLSFPSLEELSVTDCQEMITLCPGTIEAGKLSQVKLGFGETIPLEIDLNYTMRKKFLRKSEWEGKLELRDRVDLQEIWRVSLQIPHFCFKYLNTLIIDGCQFISDLLPFTLLPSLPKLQTLRVLNCDSVKTIFDVKCTREREDTLITFPCVQLLEEVYVENCKCLTSVFPASVAKDLEKLKNVGVKHCEVLMEIVAETNAADPKATSPKLTLPGVTSLTLWDLPKFNHKSICGIHDATSTFQLIISNLEDMTVGEKELKKIVDGEFQINLLEKLKVLTLGFDIECDELPDYGFLQQLPNVKKLVVCHSSFKVILCLQRPNNGELLLQLKELRLESLEELVSIGLENSWTEPFVRNLETFEVIRCSSLKNLVASTVSFSSLTCLKVERCHNLSYLLTSSTVKSLGELKRMEIEDCESIEEIVSKEEKESDEDEIIFPKLNCLNLKYLGKLRRFYRGSLSFPSLEELSVTYCHKIITLCPGTIEAGKLSQVKLGFGETIPLEIDLKYTMRKKFLREISELKQLQLKSRPLHEIWHGSLHDFCFSELDTLIVEDCQFLSDAVLSFHLLSLLPKLETLKVRNCDSVKTIFDVKCTAQDTPINFPLKKLVLSKLPKLEIVWNEGPHRILSMHNLEEVFVDRCKCLKSVFPASIVKDLVELEYLEVKDCEGLMAIVAEECHDEDEEIIFERLQVLDLERLEELRCFYAGKFTLSFPSLNEVHVIKCSSMKTFSGDNKIDHLIKWYYSEYKRSREESDLNSAVRRTFEKEVMIT